MMGSMMRRGSFGDGATLSLDFTTGTLDPLLTFTRSSSGTYLGADGLVKTASTNGARFEYDTSGNPLGLLIEGGATNLLVHTERLDEAQVSTEQYWVTTYSVTGNTASATGPDGVSNSATQFGALSGNGTCISSAAMGTSAQRSFSFWAKRSSGSTNLEYTLDNGTTWVAVTTTSSWKRFTIAATTAAQRVGFRFAANNVYEIWGCQLETGSGSTSYIKNVSAAGGASRAADSCVMTGTAFSSWFAGATEGVIYAEYERPRKLVGADHFLVGSVYAAGSFIGSYVQSSTLFPSASISPGGGFRSSTVSVAAVTPTKQATRWFGTNNVLVVANGVVGSTHAATTGTPSITMFSIGASSTSGTAATGDWLNACISRIKFWPTALPNAQLQSLTT